LITARYDPALSPIAISGFLLAFSNALAEPQIQP
jgi:hypothetical protein